MTKKNHKPKNKRQSSSKKVRVQAAPKRRGKPQAFNLELGGSIRQTLTSTEMGGRAKMNISSTAIPAATTECMRPFFTVGKGSLKDSMRVQGLEVLHDGAFDPATFPGGPVIANTVHKVFPVNPVTIASSRLRDLSLLYTKYVFRSVRLHWVPRAAIVNTHNAGELMVSFERDADAALAPGSVVNYEDMFAREGSVASAVYSGFTATYKPNDLQLTYYVSGNVSDADPRLEQQAYAYLITGTLFQENLSDGDGYGRFYVEYDIELFAPRTDSITSGIWWAETAGTASSITYPFGTAPVQASSPYARMSILTGETFVVISASQSGILSLQTKFATPWTPTAATYGGNLQIAGISGQGTFVTLLSGTLEQPESETEPIEYGAFLQIFVNASTDYTLALGAYGNGSNPDVNTPWASCFSKAYFIPSTMLGPSVTMVPTPQGRLRSVRAFDPLFGADKPKIKDVGSKVVVSDTTGDFDDAEVVEDTSELMRDLLKAFSAIKHGK